MNAEIRTLGGSISAGDKVKPPPSSVPLVDRDAAPDLSGAGNTHVFGLEELFAAADRTRAQTVGDRVFLRGIIEFSNHCRCNCLYCGLRRDNTALARYRLSDADILAAARQAVQEGMDTVVLQSGEDPANGRERIARLVATIKDETGLAVTLSLGNRSSTAYRMWRRAGADRYLLKHETANASLYAQLHPEDTLERRLHALHRLLDLGYETGSGFIVGLPGQTDDALQQNVELAQKLEVKMCGVGPFLPQRDTPLAGTSPGSTADTLKAIAMLRLRIPTLNIPATTALVSLIPEHAHELALRAGANVIMPSFTPDRERAQYQIYDGKARVDSAAARAAIAQTRRTCMPQRGCA